LPPCLDSRMRQKTLGDFLSEARSTHRLSLGELSKRTRIRLEYLEALENNRFDLLPAATFVKGYVRIYARLFGFDPQPLLAMLRRDFKESARGQLIPREFLKSIHRRSWLFRPITAAAVIAVAILLSVAAYFGWQWWDVQRPPRLLVEEPAAFAEVGPLVVVSGKTAVDARVVINDQPVALRADGAFATELALPNEGMVTITVEATNQRGRATRIERRVYVSF